MAKNNFHSLITGFIACFVFLCSCENSINSIDASISKPGSVDYIAEDEPEIYQEAPTIPKQPSIDEKKQKLVSVYRGYIGIREKTGKNDGPEVEKFLAHEGLGKGFAWCAAFVSFCLDSAGFENSINAWSPTAHNPNGLIYNKRKFVGNPEPGHVFTIYYPKRKRIGHTGFYDGWASENVIKTVEGNTNSRKSREGDGVYVILRPIGTIHSITSWFGK